MLILRRGPNHLKKGKNDVLLGFLKIEMASRPTPRIFYFEWHSVLLLEK